MKSRPGQLALRWAFLCICLIGVSFAGSKSHAAPYAAMVMDARTGEVLHSRNADMGAGLIADQNDDLVYRISSGPAW